MKAALEHASDEGRKNNVDTMIKKLQENKDVNQ